MDALKFGEEVLRWSRLGAEDAEGAEDDRNLRLIIDTALSSK